MDKKEFVFEATHLIHSKKEKAEVEQELLCHLDDRIEYYVNTGLSYEQAEQKAIAQMGNLDDVAFQLGKIHSKFWDITAILFLVLSNLFALDHFWFFILAMDSSISGYNSLREISVFLSFAVTSIIAINRRWAKLPLVNLVSVFVWSLIPFVQMGLPFCSPSAYFLECLLSGNLDDFVLAMNTKAEMYATGSLPAESIALYVVLVVLSVLLSLCISRLNVDKIKRSVPIIFSLLLAISVAGQITYRHYPENNQSIEHTFSAIYIEGSDDKKTITSKSCLDVNWDWNNYPYIENDYFFEQYRDEETGEWCPRNDFKISDDYEIINDTQSIGNSINYGVQTTVIKLKCPTKYYRIVGAYDSYNDGDEFTDQNSYKTDWMTVKDSPVYEDSIHQHNPVNFFRLEFQ